mmetsp:Transcript_85479/g.148162  ORF Transcript_85479/g.148162 Transcript_85479/m.148162 type:complete len:263 (+) Transcript_85479:47-835(+)
MHSIACVLIGLAVTGSARRVQTSIAASAGVQEWEPENMVRYSKGELTDAEVGLLNLKRMLIGVSAVAFNPSLSALGPCIRPASIGRRPSVPAGAKQRNPTSLLTMSGHTDHEPTSVLDQYNSRRQFLGTSAAAALAATLTAASPAYAKNSVSFSNVKDGDTVPSKFTYKFEVTGYELSPAAAGLKEGTGHHHLVIDGPKAFVDKGEAIPFDATHKHYGKAQTEGELELEPGKHKLTLQFANALHESYGQEFAKTITVNVKDA